MTLRNWRPVFVARSSHSHSLCGLSLPCLSYWRTPTVFRMIPFLTSLLRAITEAINDQARAVFSSASFRKQKRQEALLSHLPPHTHEYVKLALLATPSSSLFFDDIIKKSLTQMKEDSQIKTSVESFFTKGWQAVCLYCLLLGSDERLVLFLVFVFFFL